MNRNLIKSSILSFAAILYCTFNSFGQNALSTVGGHIKSTGGSTSFTVGQVAYVLKKGNGPYLNEGVQQVYTKKTTPVEELVYLKEVQLYPNPHRTTKDGFYLVLMGLVGGTIYVFVHARAMMLGIMHRPLQVPWF